MDDIPLEEKLWFPLRTMHGYGPFRQHSLTSNDNIWFSKVHCLTLPYTEQQGHQLSPSCPTHMMESNKAWRNLLPFLLPSLISSS